MLRDKFHDTAFQFLQPTTRKTQDWFDENYEETKALVAETNRRHIIYELDPSSAAKTKQLSPRFTVQYCNNPDYAI